MTESTKPQCSFFNCAAWASVLVPLVTFGVTFVIFRGGWHVNFDIQEDYLLGAFCLQIVSLISGIVSLFGIPKLGAEFILWKAVVGILASCGMGFLALVGLVVNGLGHNC